jgi:copper chaperone
VTTETIAVPDIHCDHCKTSIEGALALIDGVTDAWVDVNAGTVTVDYDERAIERAGLVAAIEEQGYEVPASA